MLQVVEGADEDEDHLLVEVGDIVPNKEHNGTKLTSNGDCVLGVQTLVFISLTWSNQVPVNDSWLDGSSQLDEQSSVSELRIVKCGNWIGLAHPVE